jgi:hypothetical protein
MFSKIENFSKDEVIESLDKAKQKLDSLINYAKNNMAVRESIHDPSVQDPSMQDPSVKDPSVQDPSVQDTSVQDPSAPDPSVQDPSVQDPSVQDPSAPDPSVQDPSTPDPSVHDPSVQLCRTKKGTLIGKRLKKDTFICIHCGKLKTFQKKEGLKRHFDNHHRGELKERNCAQCSKKFFSKESFENHIRNFHQ